MLCDLLYSAVDTVEGLGLLDIPVIGDWLITIIELVAGVLNCSL